MNLSQKTKIDLHIHSKDCSDGKKRLPEIFEEASRRGIGLISITDHDSLDCQESAQALARYWGIEYLNGLELNVSFSHPRYRNGKPIPLDFLAYQYDIHYQPLVQKLQKLREYRRVRAQRIMEKINEALTSDKKKPFGEDDLEAIEASVDGSFGRPHIANYMVKKGIVGNKQAAFDRYLVRCDVPKMPLPLAEASALVKGAGGKIVLAHPNDPRGTSLVSFTKSLLEQQEIIRETMLPYIDGIECWRSVRDQTTVESYLAFAKKERLVVTGGSDCHQQPILMGSADVPLYVAGQFGIKVK